MVKTEVNGCVVYKGVKADARNRNFVGSSEHCEKSGTF